jgi:hypothetical protein
MKIFSLIIVTLLGSTIQIESQDVVARLAATDMEVSVINEVDGKGAQDTVKPVRTPQSVTALKKSPHLQFMGMPIDGNLEEIAPKLIEKGFRQCNYNKNFFSGRFYETLSDINVYTDGTTEKVNSIEVSFFTGVNGLSEIQMISLYNRIVRGLKKKYTTAKFSQLDGKILLSMPLGYISCEIYNLNFPRNFGGGTYIKLRYVDKANTSNYSLPRLDKADDDL